MAVGLSVAAANAALDDIAATYTWVQLHTGDPGASGTSNIAAETSRKQATFGSATGGALTTSADLTWPTVAGSEDYTHASLWTASSGGSFGASGTITANPVTAGDTFVALAGNLDISLPVAS